MSKKKKIKNNHTHFLQEMPSFLDTFFSKYCPLTTSHYHYQYSGLCFHRFPTLKCYFIYQKWCLLNAVHSFLVMQYAQASSSYFFTTMVGFPKIYAGFRTDYLGKSQCAMCGMALMCTEHSPAKPGSARCCCTEITKEKHSRLKSI